MEDWRDEAKREYEDLKRRFRRTSSEEFNSGQWFAELVHWILKNYAETVSSDYIKRKYPGAGPANQAKKLITFASRYNAIAGGLSASAITALEVSTLGPQAVVTVPAISSVLFTDIAFSTRTQLRAVYDLSVIHGCPLSPKDAEDCYLLFHIAMGVKLHEILKVGTDLGPFIVKYNIRKLLRAGVRKALQEGLKRVGGVRLAKILTERAAMRLLLPGISIPIASGFNYYFTRRVLNIANAQMAKRGAIVLPLTRLHRLEPRFKKTIGPKLLIAIANLGDPEGWSEAQMEALRHCQSAVSMTDEEIVAFEAEFDHGVDGVIKELPDGFTKGKEELLQLAIVQAAFADDDHYDSIFADAITKLSTACGADLSQESALRRIQKERQRLSLY